MDHSASPAVESARHAVVTPAWRRVDLLWLPLAFAVIGLAALTLALSGPLSPAWEGGLAALLIAVLGLPHGALDHAIIRRGLAGSMGPRWIGLLLLIYVAPALFVLAGWLFMPVGVALAFLIVLAIHFSDDANRLPGWRNAVERLAFGLMPVALPIALHPDEAIRVFGLLTGDAEIVAVGVRFLEEPLGLLLAASAGAASLLLFWQFARRRRAGDALALADLGLTAALFVWLPPLIAFAFYFCLLHAPKHVLVHARLIALPPCPALARTARRMAPWALLILLGAGAGIALIAQGATSPAGLAGWLFVAVVALKTPHMLIASRALRLGRPVETGQPAWA